MAQKEWIKKLSQRYDWLDENPGPETVVQEATQRDIDSLDFLIDKLDERTGPGYARWKNFREYHDTFLGTPDDE
jgi:hypothetical protein